MLVVKGGLIVLRHSLTRKRRDARDSGSHLSPEGVRLARAMGATLPTIDYVAVGELPRHLETALALGCAVDERVSWPSGYVEGVVGHHDQWSWRQPFVHYAELLAQSSELADVVQVHLSHWQRVLNVLPDGGTALVISSGGSIEPVLVGALPEAEHSGWGAALHQLEGASLTWDGEAFTSVRFLRRG